MKTIPMMLASALVLTVWTSGAYASAGGSVGAYPSTQLEQLKKQTQITKTPNGANGVATPQKK